jgi:hypothetical protein
MEIAQNVRDILVGLRETLSPDEETLLANLQRLHERYLTVMDEFSVQVNAKALSMSPEARVVAHQLRLKIYQDWRARLMDRMFENKQQCTTAEVAANHKADCDCSYCELSRRLDSYRAVTEDYIKASARIRNPENDAGDDAAFEFPEFLASFS